SKKNYIPISDSEDKLLEAGKTLMYLRLALQNIQVLPFKDYLVPLNKAIFDVKPPYYSLAPNLTFKLDCLMKNGELLSLDVKDQFSKNYAMERLQKNSILDFSQSESLVHILSHEVANVIGPLKFFLIIILKKKGSSCSNVPGPFLILSYTNYALDLMLGHLLNDNITDIIRIGSRSKVERIASLSLENQMQRKRDITYDDVAFFMETYFPFAMESILYLMIAFLDENKDYTLKREPTHEKEKRTRFGLMHMILNFVKCKLINHPIFFTKILLTLITKPLFQQGFFHYLKNQISNRDAEELLDAKDLGSFSRFERTKFDTYIRSFMPERASKDFLILGEEFQSIYNNTENIKGHGYRDILSKRK
ncbi:hypothetical protein HDU92_006553, partial [Lobulomyces angularis]